MRVHSEADVLELKVPGNTASRPMTRRFSMATAECKEIAEVKARRERHTSAHSVRLGAARDLLLSEPGSVLVDMSTGKAGPSEGYDLGPGGP